MSENNGNKSISNSDSWVDLSSQFGMSSPTRITPVPPFGGEQDYLRMLREAQKESNRSSTKVSPISSALMSVSSTTRNSPSGSPKSPPNSPNPELADISEELKGVYINRLSDGNGSGHCASAAAANHGQSVTASELIWDWSSRPNVPPKEWKLSNIVRSRKSSSSSKLSSNNSGRSFHAVQPGFNNDGKRPAYSKKAIYTLLITNLLSLLLGAGIGMWLSKSTNSGGSQGLIDIPI